MRFADDVVLVTGGASGIGLTILINNAMVCSPDSMERMDQSRWDRDLAVNLTGAFSCTQAVIPPIRAAGGGAIVNVASVSAVQHFGNSAYSAAKAGLLSRTRSTALSFATDGIRANAVLPGTIRTPKWDSRVQNDDALMERVARWYPLRRVGTTDDVAHAVLFLASAQAAWISGVALPVDGGLLAGNLPMTAEILAEQ